MSALADTVIKDTQPVMEPAKNIVGGSKRTKKKDKEDTTLQTPTSYLTTHVEKGVAENDG